MRLPHISIQTNMVFQGLAFTGQILTALTPVLPSKYKDLIAAVLAIIQWFVSQRAHMSTPSGQPVVDDSKPAAK